MEFDRIWKRKLGDTTNFAVQGLSLCLISFSSQFSFEGHPFEPLKYFGQIGSLMQVKLQ